MLSLRRGHAELLHRNCVRHRHKEDRLRRRGRIEQHIAPSLNKAPHWRSYLKWSALPGGPDARCVGAARRLDRNRLRAGSIARSYRCATADGARPLAGRRRTSAAILDIRTYSAPSAASQLTPRTHMVSVE